MSMGGKIVLGDDGELIGLQEVFVEESVYAVLSDLFFVNPIHAKLLAEVPVEKKKRWATPEDKIRRRANARRSREDGDPSENLIGPIGVGILLIAFLCIWVVGSSTKNAPVIDLLARYPLIGVALAVVFVLAVISMRVLKPELHRVESVLKREGTLIKGEITNVHRGDLIVGIDYSFWTPEHRQMSDHITLPTETFALLTTDSKPGVGTPVAVLYVNEESYEVL